MTVWVVLRLCLNIALFFDKCGASKSETSTIRGLDLNPRQQMQYLFVLQLYEVY